MTENDLIGKQYQLLDIIGGVITEFEIMFAKSIVRDAIIHEDGSISKPHRQTLVSNDGFSWFTVYGGKQDKIIERKKEIMKATQYRILQVRAVYGSGTKIGVRVDLIVNNLEEFKSNMLKLTGADEVDITYESVDENEYKEEEEVMV